METTKIKGTIVSIGQTQEIGNFKKREFVFKTIGNYPQEFLMQCVQDKVTILDHCKAGQEVEVSYNLKGKEYQGKYFKPSVEAWFIQDLSKMVSDMQTSEAPKDDLPF